MEKAKIYKTKQKEILLKCLKENCDKHLTIEDIMGCLKTENQVIGKTTIYRYINTLVNDGIVRKYIIDLGQPACFQYMNENSKFHKDYHLHCDKCGKIIHMDCQTLKDMENHLEEKHKFKINSSKAVLYGVCDNCIKQ